MLISANAREQEFLGRMIFPEYPKLASELGSEQRAVQLRGISGFCNLYDLDIIDKTRLPNELSSAL